MPKDVEIEIQVKIENINNLVHFLKRNAKLVGTTRQLDEYFTPAHRNFIKFRPADEWLRLRDANGKFSVNYKNWHHDKKTGKTEHCDEYETRIEDIGPLRKLFSALDMKLIAKVDKKRQIWMYKSYEVSIDSVVGLGDFVEIEFKGRARKTPKEITKEMIRFLKSAGSGKIMRNYQGYPFQILFPKEIKFEEI